jgi:hypothetical protein
MKNGKDILTGITVLLLVAVLIIACSYYVIDDDTDDDADADADDTPALVTPKTLTGTVDKAAWDSAWVGKDTLVLDDVTLDGKFVLAVGKTLKVTGVLYLIEDSVLDVKAGTFILDDETAIILMDPAVILFLPEQSGSIIAKLEALSISKLFSYQWDGESALFTDSYIPSAVINDAFLTKIGTTHRVLVGVGTLDASSSSMDTGNAKLIVNTLNAQCEDGLTLGPDTYVHLLKAVGPLTITDVTFNPAGPQKVRTLDLNGQAVAVKKGFGIFDVISSSGPAGPFELKSTSETTWGLTFYHPITFGGSAVFRGAVAFEAAATFNGVTNFEDSVFIVKTVTFNNTATIESLALADADGRDLTIAGAGAVTVKNLSNYQADTAHPVTARIAKTGSGSLTINQKITQDLCLEIGGDTPVILNGGVDVNGAIPVGLTITGAAVIPAGKEVKVASGGSVVVQSPGKLILNGDPGNGAMIRGPGSVVAGTTAISSNTNGFWQAVGPAGTTITLKAVTPTAASISASGTGVAFKAGGSPTSATITQRADAAGNSLTIEANTTIDLNVPSTSNYALSSYGSIKLQRGADPGQITFPANSGTARIVVRDPSLAQSSLTVAAGDFAAAGTGYAGNDGKIAVSHFTNVVIRKRNATPALVSIEGSAYGGTLKASTHSGSGTDYATIDGSTYLPPGY